ncbi:hemagglutinin repeat-containing protein [Trinickia fusca]|uniref:Filamentous hemagglutinin N-terminal domain-containing protein n=1 Tax=Trinickia fusca TaxID=2419777 RepID=A0A494X994_9BURK|nr:hemagglutinin repeat-containing protein [Trinickia fusca]RKP44956.1 filamentous hemagglutinin N-terminal domain-containing protein [Trinickia fusca]
MNRLCYRVIFNAVRGLWMAVQETAASFGKGRHTGVGAAGRAGRAPLQPFAMLPMQHIAFAALCVFGMQPVLVQAQVIAAPSGASGNKPVVGVTANGVPIVQITTPNAAGLSNNVYTQYNVGSQGLILNNSPGTTQTQQGGYVAGNPYLSSNGARVIVNQVVGGNPSRLLGYTEVAGQQAEVVIANPSGIFCNGCGFINTSRGILTTGTPVFGGTGSLDAFHVTGGAIQIGSAGLNSAGVDQVDLIARSVQVNGKVWANRQLNVVAGANDVNHADLSTHALPADGNQPAVAIDVAQLGGMYAGKIRLVGTEAGVGVNSLGTIEAQSGDIALSSQGKVTLAGSTSASGNVQIQAAGDVSNSGALYAAQSATVGSQGHVTNSGTLAALGSTTVSGASIDSSGGLGAGVDANGHLIGTGNLTVTATGASSMTGQNLAGGSLTASGSSLNLTGAQTVANGSATLTATGAGGDTGNITHTGATLSAGGGARLGATGAVTNDKAQVRAAQLNVNAASLSNRGGQLVQSGSGSSTMTVTGSVDNTQGVIQADGGATLTAANVTNTAGRIVSLNADGLSLNASGQISNAAGTTAQGLVGGVIGGKGNVTVQASSLTNSGTLTAVQALNATVKGSLDNSGGKIETNQLTLSAASLTNEGGTLTQLGTGPTSMTVGNVIDNANGGVIETNSQDLTLAPASLNNNGGTITHAGTGTLTITAGNGAGSFTNAGGTVVGNGRIAVSAAGIQNNSGSIAAGKTLNVSTSGNVDNTQGVIQADGGATLTATNVTNTAGRIVSLNADGLSLNASGQISNAVGTTAQGLAGGVIGGKGNVTVQANSLTNSGTLTAVQALNATVKGSLDNSGGKISGAAVTANASSLKNVHGAITGATVSLTMPQLDNSGGQIETNQLTLSATNLTNEGGTLTQLGTGPMTMTVGNVIDNANGGVIETNSQDLTLAPASLNNNGGTITHAGTGTLTITAGNGAGSLTNVAGKIAGNGQVAISAGGIQNNSGAITASKTLNVSTSGNVDNTQGLLQADGGATLTAANVTNTAGRIVSLNADGLSLSASGQISNAAGTTAQGLVGGVIGGKGNVTVQANSLTNSGTLTALQALNATVKGSLDNSGGKMSGAAVTANASSLKDVHGTITGATVSLTMPQLDNSGGQIETNQLTLSATNLTNEGGTLTQLGTGPMTMTVGNVIDNANGGVIETNSQDLTLAPASLNNNGGTITHAGTGTLTITAGNGAGSLANVAGKIVGHGQVAVSAANLDNTGGSLTARGPLSATVAGALNNTGGVLHSDTNLKATSGAALTNVGGKINVGTATSAGTANTLSLSAASIDNTRGSIQNAGTGATTVSGTNQIVNSNAGGATGMGSITGGGNVTLTTAALSNTQGGQLSGTNLQINAGNLDNTGGLIGNIAHASGDVGISTTGTVNNAGEISASRNLSITTSSLSGGGVYNAGGDVTFNLQGDFSNGPGYQFNAGHSLTFNLPGTFSNSGSLVVFNNLGINASNINNTGALTAGGLLSTHSNTLTNTGSIVGGSVSLNATQTLSNLGTSALIGATDTAGTLELLAPDIENRDDTTATDAQASTTIYGLGKVVLAGGKDASGNYTNANLIRNQSALIQSGGDMEIHADLVTNTRRVVTTTGFTSSVDPALLERYGISMSGCVADPVYAAACSGQDVGWGSVPNPKQIGGVFTEPPHGGQWNSGYQDTTYTGVAVANTIASISPKSQIVAGGNLNASSVGIFQVYWSQLAATGNLAAPKKLDDNSWVGQTAPKVIVTYSGEYHYNNYDNSEHNWQLPFGDAPFVGNRPGGYDQPAPADIHTYALPGYESSVTSNGTISGTGVTINNTGGNAGITPLGLSPGETLTGVGAGTVSGQVRTDTVAGGPAPIAIIHGNAGIGAAGIEGAHAPVAIIRGIPGGGAGGASDPIFGKATALPVLNNLSVPQGGLFKADVAPNAPYLVETNPAFTNLHQWLSSDYYYQQLSFNPAQIHERLGDGFYEQRLVQNQVLSLTGKSVLGNYADTQAEYQALMTSGAKLAKSLSLAPGMGLSAQQVAALTDNVVIMQTQVVDGHSVLVPVVYLAQASRQDMSGGPVIAAKDIDLENTQGFHNSGTIIASDSMTIDAQSIDNKNGKLQSGGLMKLTTKGDIDLTSATVNAGSLGLSADGNLILDTAANTLTQLTADGGYRTTTTLGPSASLHVDGDAVIGTGGNFEQNAASLSVGGDLLTGIKGNWTLGTQLTGEHKVGYGGNGISDTNFTSLIGSSVKVKGTSTLLVDGDLTAIGANLKLDGGGTIVTGGNVSLLASRSTSTAHSNGSDSDYSADIRQADDTVTGTTLKSDHSLAVAAGKDLTITGSTIDLKHGKASLGAAGDVKIGAAAETHFSDVYEQGSHSGFGSHSSHVDHVVETTQLSDGSSISADSVAIESFKKNIAVTGSVIGGSSGVSLTAKAGNIDISAATETDEDSEFHERKQSGFTGASGGVGFGYGSSDQKDQFNGTSITQSQSRSLVGSGAGNVSISAGKDLHIGGSDIIANKAQDDTKDKTGNIAIQAQNITIDPGQDAEQSHEEQSGHSSGISMSIVGTPLDTIRNTRTAASTGKAVQRLQQTSAAVGAGSADAPSVALSFGSSSSSSTTDQSSTVNAGSTILGGGNVSLTAIGGAVTDANGKPLDGDLTVSGSTITAKGIATLEANRNVALQTSTDQSRQNTQSSSSKSSLTIASPGLGDITRWVTGAPNSSGVSSSPYNASRSSDNGNADTTKQTATVVTGSSVAVRSKKGDVNVIGSGIVGTQNVDVIANQGAINVLAGLETNNTHEESSGHQIGSLGSNGTSTGFTVGVSRNHLVQDSAEQMQSKIRSQIVSTEGDVTLNAKRDLTVKGADVSAGQNLTLMGQNVTLDPGTDAQQMSMSQSASQYGTTLALGGLAGNTIATINQSLNQAQQTHDKRLQALYGAQAGLAAYGAYAATAGATSVAANAGASAAANTATSAGTNAATNAKQGAKPTLVKVTVSVGGSSSHAQSQSSAVVNDGTALKAGGDVKIVATGSGAVDANGVPLDGDINSHGTQISGQNVTLNAAHDLNLQSAQDTNQQTSSNSSSGGSVGVGLGIGGEQNGFTIELAANRAKGHAKGNGTTNLDTQVTASQTLSITSGRDTNLRGAEVSGNTVKADVGRDLNVQSPQDTNVYDSQQMSAGVQMSICFPPLCVGQTVSGSANFAQQSIKANYQSVNQQSGIFAGQGGFDVNVGRHTQLDGGAIASTASADKNTLSTQTFGYTNLHNEASYSGESVGFSLSGGMGKSTPDGASFSAPPVQTPSNTAGPSNSAGLGPSGFGAAGTSDSASGTTYAVVSPGTITVRGDTGTGHDSTAGLDRDATHANGSVTNSFNAQKVQDDLAVQQLTVQVGMQAAGDVADALKKRADDRAQKDKVALDEAIKSGDPDAIAKAQQTADASAFEAKLWSEDGGAARTGLHTLVAATGAALGGGSVPGAVLGTIAGDTAGGWANSTFGDTLGGRLLTNIASGTAGALAGWAAGGSGGAWSGANGAFGADLYNRQLHPDEGKKLRDLQKGKSAEEQHKLAAAECALVQCAAGVPDSDPDKAALVQLQNEGQQYTKQQNDLIAAGAFDGYGAADRFNDWYDRNQMSNRLTGAVQGVGSAAVAAGAVGAGCASLVGCGLGAAVATGALDYSKAGFTEMVSGNPTSTYGEQVLESLGMSQYAAGLTYAGLNLGAAAGSVAANNAAAQAAARGVPQSAEAVQAGIKYDLTQQVADLRATLTGSAKTSGNMGVAQINIPGVQQTMAASSQIANPTEAQQALGFVGQVQETFPSSSVWTGGNDPVLLNRSVDSEAKILNNVAAQLGDNTSVSGTINLFTERAPCASCSNVIQQFQEKYPNIKINVMDNGGVVKPTKPGN